MRTIVASLFAVLLVAGPARADEKLFIEPYGGVAHSKPKVESYAEVELAIAPGKDPKKLDVVPLKGRTTYYHSGRPADRSPLEVMANYEEALRKAGFEILYHCKKSCASAKNTPVGEISAGQFYLTAKAALPAGTTWAAVRTTSATTYFFIVEE